MWGLLSGEFKDVSMGKFSNKTALGVGWSGLERILLIPVRPRHDSYLASNLNRSKVREDNKK